MGLHSLLKVLKGAEKANRFVKTAKRVAPVVKNAVRSSKDDNSQSTQRRKKNRRRYY